MARSKTRILATGTAFVALGIGYVMQYGVGLPSTGTAAVSAVEGAEDLAVTAIVDTSSAALISLPDARQVDLTLPSEPVKTAILVEDEPAVAGTLPGDVAEAPAFACDVSLTTAAGPAAQVDVSVFAPCLKNERLTLHHNGLMFTGITDAEGRYLTTVPALADKAVFIVSFGNGEGAVSQIEVPSLQEFDRVAVQWKGDAGLELHAREFGAEYFTEGHVWPQSMGSLERADVGAGGFMVELGSSDAADALRALVYTFPTAASVRGGSVHISIEAEISDANCGQEIEAQALQLRQIGRVDVFDISLNVPDCDATGGFLLVDDLFDEVIIASR